MKEALSRATKRQKVRVHPGLPSFLDGLSDLLGKNANDLLRNHTLFSLYRPFMSVDASNDLTAAMLGESPANVATLVRWGSNQLRVRKSLRWCPECASYDIRSFGFSYWHLTHQIPTVSACCTHGCELVDSIVPSSGWDTVCDLPQDTGFVQANYNNQRFAKFASNSLKFLMARKEHNCCQPLYGRAADRLGILTKTGNLRRKRLVKAMNTWWLGPFSECSGLSEKSLYRKIAKLFRGQQFRSQHLVTNLVVLANVFENAEECFDARSDIQFDNANSLEPAETPSEERLRCMQQIEDFSSISAASKAIGKSRSYVKRLAITGGLRTLQSSTQFRNNETTRLLLKAKAGYSLQEIARETNVKKSYVEFYLSCSPETQKFRKLLTYRRRQVQHRAKINEQVGMSSNQSRTSIAEQQSAAFHWLYRHDRKWLYKMLPPARKSIKPVRVDWAARDEALVSLIRDLVDKKTTPTSWAGLDKACGGRSWFSKYRHRLPKSAELAARHMDLCL